MSQEISMLVPDFQSFFKPLLDLAADGKEHSLQETRERLVDVLCLPDDDFRDMLPIGACQTEK